MHLRRFFLSLLLGLLVSVGWACSLPFYSGSENSKPVASPAAMESPGVLPTTPALPPETLAIAATAGPNGLYNPPRRGVRLMVISDLNGPYGSTTYDPEVEKAIQLVPFWNPDLVVCGGDMVAGQDRSLTRENLRAMWEAFDHHVTGPLRRMQRPYGFTVGNHDASSAQGRNHTFLFQTERDITADYWLKPEHDPGVTFLDRTEFPFYYTFEQSGIFFLVWDGSSDHIPAEKLAWVEQSLASEVAQAATLRIVLGHLPLYAVAEGRNQPGEVMEHSDRLRAMLEYYNVHTYISGHQHAYYPAHKGHLQLLHMGLLGSGPRPLIGQSHPAAKSLTLVDIDVASPDRTHYTTYDMQTLQVMHDAQLPRFLVGHNGLVLRRDVAWEDLEPTEKAACEQQLGPEKCAA